MVLGVSAVAFAYWRNDVEQETHSWLTEATRQALVIKYENVCLLPGLEGSDFGKKLFGQRQINVVLFEADDLLKLQAMSPCPVRLVVSSVASTPPEVAARAAERYGKDIR
ncbi:hypothetical protein AYO47_06230 [Planctomyces sp. SCGC AG-212-M04]|nr:hypothetical protein AYO47_06230 [Planctomyces sp. SCGC AG-212-M04]